MWTLTVSAPTSDRPPRKHLCGPAEKICLCRRESRTGGEQISAEQFLNRTALLCNAGFGKPALLGVCAAAAGALAAGLFESSRERKTLTVPEYVIRSTKLHGRARRLVFLTDLHDCEFGKDNEELLQRIRELHPDAVLIGGDMMTVKKTADISRTVRLAERLAAEYPVFYGDGNHETRLGRDRGRYLDLYDRLREQLAACGVRHLPDGSADLDPEVRISGLTITENYYAKFLTSRMEASYITSRVGSADPEKFNILLMHSPMFLKAAADWGADLVLSGHFHGGTIRLPGGIGLMTPQFQFFRREVVGRHEAKAPAKTPDPARACTMLVSAGLGTHSINLRINNRPEIVLAVLRPGNEE